MGGILTHALHIYRCKPNYHEIVTVTSYNNCEETPFFSLLLASQGPKFLYPIGKKI